MKHAYTFFIIYGIILLSAVASYILVPNLMIAISQEESIVENISAILFLVSFCTGLYFYFKSAIYRSYLMVIAIVSLIGFLDEVSFGIWYFEYKAPVIYGEYVDGFHDFFYLGLKVIYDLTIAFPYYMIALILTGTILVVTLIFRFRLILAATIRNKFSILNTYFRPLLILASIFVILLFTAMVFDLDRMDNRFLFFLEEIFEMGSGLALLFCNFSLREIIKGNPEAIKIRLNN